MNEIDWERANTIAKRYALWMVLQPEQRLAIRQKLAQELTGTADEVLRGAVMVQIQEWLLSNLDEMLATHPDRERWREDWMIAFAIAGIPDTTDPQSYIDEFNDE